jgi:6-phospho-beta-glucosidase
MRLVVLGGSGASTPELFDAIAAWPGGADHRPAVDVVLTARNAGKLELVARECRRRAASIGATLSVRTTTDRRRALEGADVVLNQVRVGGLAGRAFDESFPRAFGLPGEETMGPGGFADAMRTVPALRAAWADVQAMAPDALVVNLTNPAGIVVAAARREFPLRIVSVCDSPISLTAAIAGRLDRPTERVRARYVGMNHVGWYVPEAAGELPRLGDLALGQDPEDVESQGAVGAAYVRYYLHPDRLLAAQTGSATRADTLRELERELLVTYASGRPGGPRRGAGWYALGVVPLLDGWINGAAGPLIFGLPGADPADGRGPWAVLELPVDLTLPGEFRPRSPVELPPRPAALLAAHAEYERLTVEAILAGSSRAGLVRALAANPMVRDADLAERLLDAILLGSPGAEVPA